MTDLHVAPIQGHTDAAWRSFHSKVYGAGFHYYSPFIRLEKDGIRDKDIRDISSPLNESIDLSAQLIFKDAVELEKLIANLYKDGFRKFNLNMGCPFPLQTARGRGSAFIANKEEGKKIPDILNAYGDCDFSLKMRLGQSDGGEWREIMDSINRMSLSHVILHPRIGRQQYTGDINLKEFEEFLERSEKPVIFNGDITEPERISVLKETYPELAGVMVARGLLCRPSMFTEYLDNETWSREKRIETLLNFHNILLRHYTETLCGEHQILSKIKPFWEYSESEIGRKSWKSIKKATNMAKYNSAVASIEI